MMSELYHFADFFTISRTTPNTILGNNSEEYYNGTRLFAQNKTTFTWRSIGAQPEPIGSPLAPEQLRPDLSHRGAKPSAEQSLKQLRQTLNDQVFEVSDQIVKQNNLSEDQIDGLKKRCNLRTRKNETIQATILRIVQRRLNKYVLNKLSEEGVVSAAVKVSDLNSEVENPLSRQRFEHFRGNSRRDTWSRSYFKFALMSLETIKNDLSEEIFELFLW